MLLCPSSICSVFQFVYFSYCSVFMYMPVSTNKINDYRYRTFLNRKVPQTNKELLYAFFWVVPRLLNFICRRFGTLCSIFIGRYLPMKMEQTVCSETSAYKIQTLGNYPEDSIQQYLYNHHSHMF